MSIIKAEKDTWKDTEQKALKGKKKKSKYRKRLEHTKTPKHSFYLMKNEKPNNKNIQMCVQVYKAQKYILPLFSTPAIPDF